MTTGIQHKVAVVTGGASGIGRATALAFAREGAKVAVVTGRSMAAAEETVRQIRDLGGEAVFVQCDVTDEAQVAAMVAETVATFGRLDIAFNNAGVGPDGVTIPFGPLTGVTEAHWDCVVDTNLKGVFLCMKHELKQMREQRSGVIVNTASTAGLQAKGGFGAYSPSKAGVISLSKVAAIENKDLGIRVNVVCPGPTKGTGMMERMLSACSSAAPGRGPGAPPDEILGDPHDIARTVIWLCSHEASYIDGNVLSVDGGLDIA